MTQGLTGRMVIASGLLAIIVGGAFAAVLLSVTELRGTTDMRRQTRDALVAADTLEKQVIDLETGLRGFVITRDESFLEPYSDARAALPGSAQALERFAAGEPVQLARVRRIVRAMNAYVGQYAVPLVDAVRRNDPSVRSVDRTVTAKLRVDALREGLNSFREAERARLSTRDAEVETAARRATAAAALGIAGSIVLIIVFSGYLTRVIVRPLRRAALMANGLAEGDLSVRMPETDVGEIGALERSFNVMAGSLQASRDELVASRARLLTTGDEARRRVVQDLHDGAQQRLVQTILTLNLAQSALMRDGESADALVAEALEQAEQSNTELRELAHGLLPAALTHGGLRAGVKALVARVRVPVDVAVAGDRFPTEIEANAYFVVAEALTNVVKHSGARRAHVIGWVEGHALHIDVRDDGVGGAQRGGAGLLGLRDRVTALGGGLRVESPPGGGTRIVATLPL
jgi:signal transduction histidine kinase